MPNPPLHSDPACIAFRSLSASRFLGFVQRLGAGGAGELLSLGVPMRCVRVPKTEIDEQFINEFLSANHRLVSNEIESALGLVFTSFPKNIELPEIIVKVTTLNSLYSTHVWDIQSLSKQIRTLDIDRRLESGDFSLVHDIAKLGRNNRYLYSFSTKYCSWHRPDIYPIFDKYVGALLWHYSKQGKIRKFQKYKLFEYPVLTSLIEEFRTAFGLTQIDPKNLDKFLWIYGQECFQ